MKKKSKKPKFRKWKIRLVVGLMLTKEDLTILINPAVYIAFTRNNPLIKSIQVGIVWLIFNGGIEITK